MTGSATVIKSLRRSLGSLLVVALTAVAAAQITLPLERFLEVAELEVVAPAEGTGITRALGRDGVEVALEVRGQALFEISGEGVFDPATIAEVARLLAAASGFFAAIEEPIANYLTQNAGQLAGLGPFTVGVENYAMTLDVRGDTAPYTATWSLTLARVPEEAFLAARHTLGPSDARYVIREFSDMQCPFCARYAAQVLPALKATLLQRGDVRFEYHHFALGGGLVHGALAAQASECVVDANSSDPEAFWRYTDALFTRQSVWSPMADPAAYFVRLATDLGLEGAGVATCLAAGTHREAVAASGARASQLGIGGTPTVFVGPYRLRDFNSIEGYLQAMAWIDAFGAE
jgi:protein-disulfide isomerase